MNACLFGYRYTFVSVLAQSIQFIQFHALEVAGRGRRYQYCNVCSLPSLSNRHVSRCNQLKISSSLVSLSHCWCHGPGRREAAAATTRAWLYCAAVGGREIRDPRWRRRHFRWSCQCNFGFSGRFMFVRHSKIRIPRCPIGDAGNRIRRHKLRSCRGQDPYRYRDCSIA